MAETYTIESADDSAPIEAGPLRELRDLLRADEDLDLGVTLKDRPPAPGEQGAIPVALEIVVAAAPLSTAFTSLLKQWIDTQKVSVKVRRKDGTSIEVRAGSAGDATRLLAQLVGGNGAAPGDGA